MNLKIVKPNTAAEKATHTTVDTIMVSTETVKSWKNPPFQRPLRINEKLKAIAEQIRRDRGVIPGVITLGVLDRERYLLDGQHRREAFLISGCTDGYCDVRIHHFESMADMGREFVNINSSIVRLRPDDVLRGLEDTIEALAIIRQRCPFVGYDHVRRGDRAPILSMSLLLRAWQASVNEVPSSAGRSALDHAQTMTIEDAEQLCVFLAIVDKAWGRDPEYARLWSALNLTLSMWSYRRLVLGHMWTPDKRSAKLNRDLFTKCMMALSANGEYVSWLHGRQLTDNDRSPAYGRLKKILAKRIEDETGEKPKLPQPAWAHHQGGSK